MVDKVVDSGVCVCCGHKVKLGYRFCLGCWRKRKKIHDDCIGAGKSEEFARNKADSAYPAKFK
jgi:predicted amidophosphoribosyltransferase